MGLTNLQLSQSESLLSRLLRDQRERRLGDGLRDGLRDQERDGGRRRSWDGLSWRRSSSITMWLEMEGEGDGLRPPISFDSSAVIGHFLPHCRFKGRPCCSSSLRFLVRVRLRWKWPWRPERWGWGLGERDQDSVSEDGGRMVSVGTGMGWVRVRPCGPRGEDMVIITPLQSSNYRALRRQAACHIFELLWNPPVMWACKCVGIASKHFKFKVFHWSLTQVNWIIPSKVSW